MLTTLQRQQGVQLSLKLVSESGMIVALGNISKSPLHERWTFKHEVCHLGVLLMLDSGKRAAIEKRAEKCRDDLHQRLKAFLPE